MFRRGDDVWLVGRRNVTDTGHYDLELSDIAPEEEFLQYQVEYWNTPKRCALWRVNPDTLTVTWETDIPSKGDTCFPELIELDEGSILYNYSSDPEGPDIPWLEGQLAPTNIYRMRLDFLASP
jgi:hypothetical protein